ncbi:MAG: CYTH domain-containing protein [Clostridia bacterium]|nr:CYTH domain-containing protein [Clostridia bacterium]
MEIELKYKIENLDFDLWKAITEKYALQHTQEVKMDAVYYDTYNDDFLKKGIALRIRSEGQKKIATVKTKGSSVNGLHSREEWNKDISGFKDILFAGWFSMTAIGKDLDNIIKEQPLQEKIKTIFTRKKAIMNYFHNQFEIAVDRGKILADHLEEEIYELEIELVKGSAESMKEFGVKLMKQYDIKPENISKYARGLKLLKYKHIVP